MIFSQTIHMCIFCLLKIYIIDHMKNHAYIFHFYKNVYYWSYYEQFICAFFTFLIHIIDLFANNSYVHFSYVSYFIFFAF